MIEIDVTRQRGAFTLQARFEAASEGVIALFGRSGAGKTTLINLIAGLERPDAGRIVLDGRVLYDSEAGAIVPPERRRLGYVFQDGRLFPHLSVRRNLAYGRHGNPDGAAFDRIVDLLELRPLLGRKPGTLSGGEKQRVAIGRALLSQPDALLMDEPLASLDAGRKAEILDYIERLRAETHLPIVYVSHASDEIVRLADTLVLLSDGKVAAVGPIEDLMSRLNLRPLTGRYEAGAVIPATVAGVQDEVGLTKLDFPGGVLRVSGSDLPAGRQLRVRVRARDVSLSLSPPNDISILNVLPGTVQEIGDEPEPQVDVLIDIGCPIWARITRHARDRLGIEPGARVYALIKASAFDRRNLGYSGGPRNGKEAAEPTPAPK